jgi:ABC-type nitrate/sulfonate/bicarbonate transport system permease component
MAVTGFDARTGPASAATHPGRSVARSTETSVERSVAGCEVVSRRGPFGVRIPTRLGGAVSRWWAVALVIVIWQVWVSWAGFNRIVLPTPLEVLSDLVSNPGAYAGDTFRTLSMAIFGLVIGMSLGYLIAIGTWASPLFAGLAGPLVLMMRSIPIVAVIPVIARVVGYGNNVVPVVTVLLAFFPAYVMTTSGLRVASSTSRDVMAALGASRWNTLRRLLIPASLPNLAVAFRLVASSTVLAAMVAEFLAGTNGLGRLFSTARMRFETDRAWGAAVIATVASVLLFQFALRVERVVRARYR